MDEVPDDLTCGVCRLGDGENDWDVLEEDWDPLRKDEEEPFAGD